MLFRSTDRYKLIRYPHNGEVQLFDMKKDPWEMNNLAEKPGMQDKIKQLNKQLKKLQTQVGDKLELKDL
mgnify:CR=1 FL=1